MKNIKEAKDFLDNCYVRVALLGVVPVAILGAPLWAFFHTFAKYGPSVNNGDWANFSIFLNSFVLLCNVYLFFLLTLSVDRYTRKRNREMDAFQRGLAQPILIFRTMTKEVPGDKPKEFWHLENVGNGPALKLKIGEWKAGQWVGKVVKGYSLGQSKDLCLDWLERAALLCVTYEDTFKNKYVSIGVGDESYPMPRREWEDFNLDHSHDFTSADLGHFDKGKGIRIYEARKKDGSSTTTGQTTSPTG
jgi:hypothetical protein